jgi:aromatic-L-amino-acid decarboxylase
MTDLLKKLSDLEEQSVLLEPSQTERDHYLSQLSSYTNNFINSIDEMDAYSESRPNPEALKIKNKKISLSEAMEIYTKEVIETGIVASSGRHIGYIPGGGIYVSALADFIADVTNEYAGMYFGGPGAVTIENELINWLKTIFRFPSSALGNLTSGGSIANLIALTAARDKHGVKNELVTKSVIYLSEQVHHCTQKALRIIGLGDVIIRMIQIDEFSRIKVAHFEQMLTEDQAQGLHPFLVLASAGTTDTGAIDPLKEIGEIAKKNNLWYHVDAAYGGFFILTDRAGAKFEGIEMADSLVIDPHKGLFLPYGLGAVLVKDKEALFQSHHYTANYMQDAFKENMPINPADTSPELTKHFRGLRLWLPLQIHGIEPFKACLEEKLYLTDYFRAELIKRGFSLGPEPDLSVSYFWYPSGENEEEFNRGLMKEIHKDGKVFLSSSVIQGKYAIRMAVLSFRTKKHTIDECLEMIDRCLLIMNK